MATRSIDQELARIGRLKSRSAAAKAYAAVQKRIDATKGGRLNAAAAARRRRKPAKKTPRGTKKAAGTGGQ